MNISEITTTLPRVQLVPLLCSLATLFKLSMKQQSTMGQQYSTLCICFSLQLYSNQSYLQYPIEFHQKRLNSNIFNHCQSNVLINNFRFSWSILKMFQNTLYSMRQLTQILNLARAQQYFDMKRKYCHANNDEQDQPRIFRKRFAKAPAASQPLPCKFKLLKQWELTEQASHYLWVSNRIQENNMRDRTSSQLAIVPYSPNQYQHIIDDIAAMESFYGREPMDVEEIEICGV